jgi:flagellar basal body-associated protein FliL
MAAEQPAPPEQAPPPPPPGGRSKQFVFLILIVLIGQIGIGYWAVYRLLLPKVRAEEEGAVQERVEELAGAEAQHAEEGGGGHGGEKKEGGHEGGSPNVHGDLLDVGRVTASTIQGGELHYVILTAKIKFDSPEAAQEAGKNLSRVRDIVLHVVSVRPGEELDDVQDQERLREAIKQEVSAKLTKGKAEEVYFTQYVYQ